MIPENLFRLRTPSAALRSFGPYTVDVRSNARFNRRRALIVVLDEWQHLPMAVRKQ
jgi:hypothetical protein